MFFPKVFAWVLAFCLSFSAQACMDATASPESFFERVKPALDLSMVQEDRIFLRFGGSLDELNELIKRGRARSTEGVGKERVFTSRQFALLHSSQETTYIVGVDRVDGNVFEVWSVMDQRLLELWATKRGGCGASWS